MKKLTKKEQKALEDFKNRITKAYPALITEIILYGSKARGDAHRYSDIDVLVITKMEDGEQKTNIIGIAFDVMAEFDIELSVLVMSEKRWSHYKELPSSFAFSVMQDAVKI